MRYCTAELPWGGGGGRRTPLGIFVGDMCFYGEMGGVLEECCKKRERGDDM